MKRTLLDSKIHRATVTGTNLHYIGSIAIDAQLPKESNIVPFEKVEFVNINDGQRWETYPYLISLPVSGTWSARVRPSV